MGRSDPVGVGIIGFGRIGAEHREWLAAARGIRAVAAADATPARQSLARQRGLRVYETAEDMLADDGVEAVLVATPTAMHFDHAMLALRAGRHVLVEKPMALDLAQSRRLIHEAERVALVLSVFHNRRWDLDYLTLRAAVEAGAFGKIINVESRLGQFSSCVGPAAREYRPNWRNEEIFGGGALFDWGSHFIDQIWRLMHPARPLRVFAQLRGNVWSTDCDDFARVLIDFDGGAVAMVEINTTTSQPLPRWHVDGVSGSASSKPSPSFDISEWARLRFSPVPALEAQPLPERMLPLASPGLSETAIWEQFGEALRTPTLPAVTARSVLPTMAILDAARLSSYAGTATKLEDLSKSNSGF